MERTDNLFFSRNELLERIGDASVAPHERREDVVELFDPEADQLASLLSQPFDGAEPDVQDFGDGLSSALHPVFDLEGSCIADMRWPHDDGTMHALPPEPGAAKSAAAGEIPGGGDPGAIGEAASAQPAPGLALTHGDLQRGVAAGTRILVDGFAAQELTLSSMVHSSSGAVWVKLQSKLLYREFDEVEGVTREADAAEQGAPSRMMYYRVDPTQHTLRVAPPRIGEIPGPRGKNEDAARIGPPFTVAPRRRNKPLLTDLESRIMDWVYLKNGEEWAPKELEADFKKCNPKTLGTAVRVLAFDKGLLEKIGRGRYRQQTACADSTVRPEIDDATLLKLREENRSVVYPKFVKMVEALGYRRPGTDALKKRIWRLNKPPNAQPAPRKGRKRPADRTTLPAAQKPRTGAHASDQQPAEAVVDAPPAAPSATDTRNVTVDGVSGFVEIGRRFSAGMSGVEWVTVSASQPQANWAGYLKVEADHGLGSVYELPCPPFQVIARDEEPGLGNDMIDFDLTEFPGPGDFPDFGDW